MGQDFLDLQYLWLSGRANKPAVYALILVVVVVDGGGGRAVGRLVEGAGLFHGIHFRV